VDKSKFILQYLQLDNEISVIMKQRWLKLFTLSVWCFKWVQRTAGVSCSMKVSSTVWDYMADGLLKTERRRRGQTFFVQLRPSWISNRQTDNHVIRTTQWAYTIQTILVWNSFFALLCSVNKCSHQNSWFFLVPILNSTWPSKLIFRYTGNLLSFEALLFRNCTEVWIIYCL
jgi:hypothetical protein